MIETISEAFIELAKLAERLKIAPLNSLPGLWELQLNDEWWLAVNGHKESLTSSHGNEVKPFNCYVEFNGWPAGYFSPHEGMIAAGALANENTFIEAVKKYRVVAEQE